MFQSGKNKSPWSGGIISEFYMIFWDIIKTEFIEMIKYVLKQEKLTETQTQGIMVLIKKVINAKSLEQYRPITHYKIMVCTITNRMSKVIG